MDDTAKMEAASEPQAENGVDAPRKKRGKGNSDAPRKKHAGKVVEASRKKQDAEESNAHWLNKKFYEEELARLQFELIKLQYWVIAKGLRVVIIFEGRDAAGKGGLISRIIEPLNPRGIRLVALGKPSDVERTQWYFQRYVTHLPAAGEIVIFDRSWYNRAGVERVMGFCTDEEYWDFLSACPAFERILARSGIILLKYWLSVSDEEQERRFQSRAGDPTRRWKLSPIDLASRDKWVAFSKAKDLMMEHTDIPEARWYQVESEDKRRARLNCIRHVLNAIPYEDVIPPPIELPPRPRDETNYVRPPRDSHMIVPDYYADR
jgi:polyphosphate kinase 2